MCLCLRMCVCLCVCMRVRDIPSLWMHSPVIDCCMLRGLQCCLHPACKDSSLRSVFGGAGFQLPVLPLFQLLRIDQESRALLLIVGVFLLKLLSLREHGPRVCSGGEDRYGCEDVVKFINGTYPH